jgi:threonine synthase
MMTGKQMDISYRSTRSPGGEVSSSSAILSGIAPDGGLYVPVSIPPIDRSFDELAHLDYRGLAHCIISSFFTDLDTKVLRTCIDNAYDEKYDDSRIVPVEEKAGISFIELFHGPTLAFKDMALTMLPHLLKAAAAKAGNKKEIVILTATSGDTGKAALEGFAGVEGTRIIVFYPKNGVSRIQERQMTTQEGANAHVIAIDGNFDHAQKGVKAIFSDRDFGEELDRNGYMFSSANSINIGRLVPQIVYYFHSWLELFRKGKIKDGDRINVVVPTGNFGNILAAYYSREMGLPVNRLICASNINNVLTDFINTGIYDARRKFVVTSSPAMDILVSSNLERLLFDLAGKDPDVINRLISDLSEKKKFSIGSDMREGLASFYGGFATEEETSNAIKEVYEQSGYLIDTHTAVGYSVYRKYLEETGDGRPAVIASTASPFKFPGSVAGAIDQKFRDMDEFSLMDVLSWISGIKVPGPLEDLESKKIIHNKSCSTDGMKKMVSEILGIRQEKP